AKVSSIPSRANILSLLLSLITNPNIEHGDPIIIFFAGHGSRYPLSDDDDNPDTDGEHDDERSRKFVEALCPMDRNTRDSGGVLIPDITDRELNTILSQISRSKGHRIQFILDRCHAGSIIRTLNSRVRTVSPLERASIKDMFRAGEETLKDYPGYRSISAEDWVPDMVAACKAGELAKARRVKKEKETEVWSGIFTSSLIKTLSSGVLGEGATYVDLVNALPRPSLRHHSQTPVVAGGRKNTRLWYQD
ncbi:hypothetical protein DFS33DRAFT_1328668, partial [Desarmillaria ectypa]